MDCVPPFKCGNTDSKRIDSTRFKLLHSLGLQYRSIEVKTKENNYRMLNKTSEKP